MKLVTGGAFQGKLAYAEERYGVWDGWIDGRSCALSEIKTCRGIYAFHEYVRRWLEQERDAFEDEPNKRKTDGEHSRREIRKAGSFRSMRGRKRLPGCCSGRIRRWLS